MTIEFTRNVEGEWELRYNGSIQFTQTSLDAYTSTFSLDQVKMFYGELRVLVIGGGSMAIIRELLKNFQSGLNTVVVDPIAGEYCPHLSKMYLEPPTPEDLDRLDLKVYKKTLEEFVQQDLPYMDSVFDLVIVERYDESVDEVYKFLTEKIIAKDVRYRAICTTQKERMIKLLEEDEIKYIRTSRYLPQTGGANVVISFVPNGL